MAIALRSIEAVYANLRALDTALTLRSFSPDQTELVRQVSEGLQHVVDENPPWASHISHDLVARLSQWSSKKDLSASEMRSLQSLCGPLLEGISLAVGELQGVDPSSLQPDQWVFIRNMGPGKFMGVEQRVIQNVPYVFYLFRVPSHMGASLIKAMALRESSMEIRPISPAEEFQTDFANVSSDSDWDRRRKNVPWVNVLKIGYPQELQRLIKALVFRLRHDHGQKTGAVFSDTDVTLLRRALFQYSAEAALALGCDQEKVLKEIHGNIGAGHRSSIFAFSHYIKEEAPDLYRPPGAVDPARSMLASVKSATGGTYVAQSVGLVIDDVPSILGEVKAAESDFESAAEAMVADTATGAIDKAILRLPLSALVKGRSIQPGDGCRDLSEYLGKFRFEEIDGMRVKSMVGVTPDTILRWGKMNHPKSLGKVILLYYVLVSCAPVPHIPDLIHLVLCAYPKLRALLLSESASPLGNSVPPIVNVKFPQEFFPIPFAFLTYQTALGATHQKMRLEEIAAGIAERLQRRAPHPDVLWRHLRGKIHPDRPLKGGSGVQDILEVMWGGSTLAFLILRPIFEGADITAFGRTIQESRLGQVTEVRVDISPMDGHFQSFTGGRYPLDTDHYPAKYFGINPDPFGELLRELAVRERLGASKVGNERPKMSRAFTALRDGHQKYQALADRYSIDPASCPFSTPFKIERFYRYLISYAESARRIPVGGNVVIEGQLPLRFEISPATPPHRKAHQLEEREGVAVVPPYALVLLHEVAGEALDLIEVTHLHVAFSHYRERHVITERDLEPLIAILFPASTESINGKNKALAAAYRIFLKRADERGSRPLLDEGWGDVRMLYRHRGAAKKEKVKKNTEDGVGGNDRLRRFLEDQGILREEADRVVRVLDIYRKYKSDAQVSYDDTLMTRAIQEAPGGNTLEPLTRLSLYSALNYLKLQGPLSFTVAAPAPLAIPMDVSSAELPVSEVFPEDVDIRSRADVVVGYGTVGVEHPAALAQAQGWMTLLTPLFWDSLIGESPVAEGEIASALEALMRQRMSLLKCTDDVGATVGIISAHFKNLQEYLRDEIAGFLGDPEAEGKTALLKHRLCALHTSALREVVMDPDLDRALPLWLADQRRKVTARVKRFISDLDYIAGLPECHRANHLSVLSSYDVIPPDSDLESALEKCLHALEWRVLAYGEGDLDEVWAARRKYEDFRDKLPEQTAMETIAQPVIIQKTSDRGFVKPSPMPKMTLHQGLMARWRTELGLGNDPEGPVEVQAITTTSRQGSTSALTADAGYLEGALRDCPELLHFARWRTLDDKIRLEASGRVKIPRDAEVKDAYAGFSTRTPEPLSLFLGRDVSERLSPARAYYTQFLRACRLEGEESLLNVLVRILSLTGIMKRADRIYRLMDFGSGFHPDDRFKNPARDAKALLTFYHGLREEHVTWMLLLNEERRLPLIPEGARSIFQQARYLRGYHSPYEGYPDVSMVRVERLFAQTHLASILYPDQPRFTYLWTLLCSHDLMVYLSFLAHLDDRMNCTPGSNASQAVGNQDIINVFLKAMTGLEPLPPYPSIPRGSLWVPALDQLSKEPLIKEF